jgi:hypothetical protein
MDADILAKVRSWHPFFPIDVACSLDGSASEVRQTRLVARPVVGVLALRGSHRNTPAATQLHSVSMRHSSSQAARRHRRAYFAGGL